MTGKAKTDTKSKDRTAVIRGFASSVALASALALSACGADSLPFMDKEIILPCPNYYILEDAANLTQFQEGPGRDIIDVLARARIGEMQLTCLSDIDTKTDSGKMVVDVSPIIAAEMGPANTSNTATLPYFVVVTDPDKKILYREPLSVRVSFEGNKTQIVLIAPPTSIELPITPKIRNDYYRIYSGFELTKEQVEYNRKAIQDRLQ